eukprot:TRINITY_DN31102_c0_g1_i1.p1 TRINITY_DN31102_c0_g1~~TRINITY_DN31102_c0_g1_i1.p1  ORF type:complete len:540 (+),score=101.03 TRINITY_DN31102_c0_g1_i1:36-1655(+)
MGNLGSSHESPDGTPGDGGGCLCSLLHHPHTTSPGYVDSKASRPKAGAKWHAGRKSRVERHLGLLKSALAQALTNKNIDDATIAQLQECERLARSAEAAVLDDCNAEDDPESRGGVSQLQMNPEVRAWLNNHWSDSGVQTNISHQDLSRAGTSGDSGSSQVPDCPVAACVSIELQRLIDKVGAFDLDVVAVANQPEVAGNVITVLFMSAFRNGGFNSKLSTGCISADAPQDALQDRLFSYMKSVDEAYLRNTYHNNMHAADVAMVMHWLCQSARLQSMFTPLDHFTAIVAAAIHDVGHDGVNNIFHVNTQSQVALRYNDKSCLENMHIALSFELMREKEENNWLALLSKKFGADAEKDVDLQQYVRKLIIEAVLATDTVKHNMLMADLKELVNECKNSPLRSATSESRMTPSLNANTQSKQNMLNVLLHAADVSNPTRPTNIALYWSRAVLSEFWAQGDEERRLGIQVSPLCDRASGMAGIPQGQIGFINFIVKPLFTDLQTCIPEVSTALTQLDRNIEFWQKKKEENATFDDIFKVFV